MRIAGGNKLSHNKARVNKKRPRNDAVQGLKLAFDKNLKMPKSAPSVLKKPSVKRIGAAASLVSFRGRNAPRLSKRNRSTILRKSLQKFRPISAPKSDTQLQKSLDTYVSRFYRI